MKSIETVIREEIVLHEELRAYSIPELAETLRKLGYDDQGVKAIQQVLLNAYRKAGDEGVIDTYTQMSGVQIQAIRNGRYVFAGLQTPSDYNIYKFVAEVQDNAMHTPDEMPS
jgi:hypothetical protein